jgi:hypothetical protein
MTQNDRDEFGALLSQALAFYGITTSKFALGVWWQACSGFELEQVRKALTAHAMDPDRGQFVPKPADLVRQLQGTHADRSLIAWGKVHDAIGRIGAWKSVVFDDPAIHAAIADMGGWPAVCASKVDELPFLQKRFCDLHRAYSQRPDTPYPPRLVGNAEATNALNGREVAPPLLVGDPQRAAAVQQGGQAGGRSQITIAGAALPAAITHERRPS